MREQQLGVVAGDALVREDVDVERARAPADGADPAEGVLDRVGPLQQGARRQRGAQHDDGVVVVGLLLGPAEGLRLVHPGHGLDPQSGGVGEGVHGPLKGFQPVAQVAAEGDRGVARVVQGGVRRVHPALQVERGRRGGRVTGAHRIPSAAVAAGLGAQVMRGPGGW